MKFNIIFCSIALLSLSSLSAMEKKYKQMWIHFDTTTRHGKCRDAWGMPVLEDSKYIAQGIGQFRKKHPGNFNFYEKTNNTKCPRALDQYFEPKSLTPDDIKNLVGNIDLLALTPEEYKKAMDAFQLAQAAAKLSITE